MGRRLRIEQAHHEAAHCVAAIAQGLCVRWVTLAPVGNHAAGTHVERAIFSAADNPDAQIEALKIDITVALAGACAQMKLRPTLKRNQKWGDFQLSAAWASLAAFLASGMNIDCFWGETMRQSRGSQSLPCERRHHCRAA
jgi:hypothetical protein